MKSLIAEKVSQFLEAKKKDSDKPKSDKPKKTRKPKSEPSDLPSTSAPEQPISQPKKPVINLPYDERPEMLAAMRLGKSNKDLMTPQKIAEFQGKIVQAKNIAKQFEEAYDNNVNTLKVYFQGKEYNLNIYLATSNKEDVNGNPINYKYYFSNVNQGDGGFQVKLDKRGYLQSSIVSAAPKMADEPDISSATDSGTFKTFDNRMAYFRVKAGIKGKYQMETKNYSIFPSPALDAAVKALIAFGPEMIDFISPSRSYTSDDAGKAIANKMDVPERLRKIRLDAERILNRPIALDQTWKDFVEKYKRRHNNPFLKFSQDIEADTNDFIEMWKASRKTNPFEPKSTAGRGQITMDPEEAAELERKRKEAEQRYADFLARKAKGKGGDKTTKEAFKKSLYEYFLFKQNY